MVSLSGIFSIPICCHELFLQDKVPRSSLIPDDFHIISYTYNLLGNITKITCYCLLSDFLTSHYSLVYYWLIYIFIIIKVNMLFCYYSAEFVSFYLITASTSSIKKPHIFFLFSHILDIVAQNAFHIFFFVLVTKLLN